MAEKAKDGWREETLARMRALILEADPEMIEERKWRKPSNKMAGVPVWPRYGSTESHAPEPEREEPRLHPMITIFRTAIAIALLARPMAGIAAAQNPAPVAEVAVGWIGFADDGIVSETLVGGAARWYVLPRIAIGPEILLLSGDNHNHLVITGNVTVDLLAPRNGRPRAVTPFLVVGGGMFQTREDFPAGPFTSREGAFTLGGGVRARAGERVTLGLDTRIGWETHLRVNGTIGVRLGR